MPEWETLAETEWLDQIAGCWLDAGSRALQSRGHFNVAMDASDECLQLCRHLTGIDWPWSATRILAVRENWVPAGHSRHCGSAIYRALYPQKVSMLPWETEHMSHQQSVARYAKALQKEIGETPKMDLTLLALSGNNTLAELEAGENGIPEFELTSLYQIKGRGLPALGLTPRLLNASRNIVCISRGLNPPVTDTFRAHSPLQSLAAQDKVTFLHTR
ncbi:MAG: 6-phosphogluconolactonase [Verrucomicrobiota bacterium]